MGITALSEFISTAAKVEQPQLTLPLGIGLGGVDPLGLRQINFDLMDLVIPGLNNVARHIRPFTVIAWAWHRAAICAQKAGLSKVSLDELQDFVDRIEVIFVWSQLLRDPSADLPGRDVLGSLRRSESYEFGGAKWKQRRNTRKYSTALSAPVNYGPAVKSLGWIEASDLSRGAFRSSELVKNALNAMDAALGKHLNHAAFSRIGRVTVSKNEVNAWGNALSIDQPSPQEQSAMCESLSGESAPEALKRSVNVIAAISRKCRSTDDAVIRSELCRGSHTLAQLGDREPVPTIWTLVQMRQLFRLSLEALLRWILAKLTVRPAKTSDLVGLLLSETRSASSTQEWLKLDRSKAQSIPEQLLVLQKALDDNDPDLAKVIQTSLAMSLVYVADSPVYERGDRLPLARAREETKAFESQPAEEFVKHVLASWVLGQHIYWSIARGLGDARGGGRTILRLRAVPEENGWTLAPGMGMSLGSPPRATPDRLATLLGLMRESGVLHH